MRVRSALANKLLMYMLNLERAKGFEPSTPTLARLYFLGGLSLGNGVWLGPETRLLCAPALGSLRADLVGNKLATATRSGS
jgi:hypothetical protein